MVFLAIGGALLGATLGLRFKVLALLPAMVFGIFSIVVFAAIRLDGLATTAAAIGVWAGVVQIGYLGGLVIRGIVAAARSPRPRRAPHLIGRSRAGAATQETHRRASGQQSGMVS